MAQCNDSNGLLFGGAVVLEMAHGCPSTKPKESDWKLFMAGTSKGLDLGMNTVTSNADDAGPYSENIVTNSDLTVSFEGEVRKSDVASEIGFHNTLKYIVDEITAKRQPALWVRLNQGGSLLTAYMVITKYSSSGGTKDLYTCSAEFKVASGKSVSVELAASDAAASSGSK